MGSTMPMCRYPALASLPSGSVFVIGGSIIESGGYIPNTEQYLNPTFQIYSPVYDTMTPSVFVQQLVSHIGRITRCQKRELADLLW